MKNYHHEFFAHRTSDFGILALFVGLFFTIGVGSTEAQTAKPANPIVSVNAREQRLTAFLNELLGAAGYSTVISSAKVKLAAQGAGERGGGGVGGRQSAAGTNNARN